jgi:hypothetical protein
MHISCDYSHWTVWKHTLQKFQTIGQEGIATHHKTWTDPVREHTNIVRCMHNISLPTLNVHAIFIHKNYYFFPNLHCLYCMSESMSSRCETGGFLRIAAEPLNILAIYILGFL